jgi:hypothetical protein
MPVSIIEGDKMKVLNSNPKKVCNICGNRVRGKGFVFYDEISHKLRELRECIPMCKDCDNLVSINAQVFSLWYGLYRINPLHILKREECKIKQKRKK